MEPLAPTLLELARAALRRAALPEAESDVSLELSADAAAVRLPREQARELDALLDELLRAALAATRPDRVLLSLEAAPGPGGEISVRAAVGARVSVPAAEPQIREPLSPQSRHVLVCDDDATCNELVRAILSESGFLVTVAEDGEAGLQAIRSLKPGIVLLDIDMPVKTGLEVLRELRDSPPPVSPVVLILSNHETTRVHDLCRDLGAADTMEKPFIVAELVQRLQGLAFGRGGSA